MRLTTIAFVILLASAASASAQAVFSGVVIGPDGLPVEGVTIFLTNVTTKSQLDFPTTSEGRFEFSGLPPGEYRVTSMTSGIGNFNVILAAGEPQYRELTIPFGPFRITWQVVPPNPLVVARGPQPGFRCLDRQIVIVSGRPQPLCVPQELVGDFQQGEAARLTAVALGPRLISVPELLYPQSLVDRRIEGTVTIEGRVAVNGSVGELRAVSSDHADLIPAALASAASATWEAARMRGSAIEVPMTITIQFRLAASVSPAVVQSVAGH